MEYPALLAGAYGGIHLFRFSSVKRLEVREAAQLLHMLEHEPSDVDGEQRRGVVQALALRERLVGQTQRNGNCTECCCGVDVDEAVLSYDEDRQPRGTDVLLRAGKYDGVLAEMGDRAGHERGRVVADEREEAARARQEVEGKGRLRGGVRRELDAVDRLVLAVVDERWRGREGVLAVWRNVVEGHTILGVLASIERDVHAGATGKAPSLVVCLFAPRAGEDVVHDALVVGEVWIE